MTASAGRAFIQPDSQSITGAIGGGTLHADQISISNMPDEKSSADRYSEHLKKCASDRGLSMDAYRAWLVKQPVLDAAFCRVRQALDGMRVVNALDLEAEAVSRMADDPDVRAAGFDRMQLAFWWSAKKPRLWN